MVESSFPFHLLDDLIKAALAEDLGMSGDLTSLACLDENDKTRAAIIARQKGVAAGLPLAEAAFRALDENIEITRIKHDGDALAPGDVLLEIYGPARAILAAERVALNFLGHLSGIASLTALYVEKVRGTGAPICDTRKTLPGLRALQKYAVRAGGGQNHRLGLFDAVLVKDNHIAAAGGIDPLMKRLRSRVGHMVRVEVEVDDLDQLAELIPHSDRVDVVLLDNMSPAMLRRAVKMARGKMLTEASGGVNLERVGEIAASGVDLISIGALTHSAPCLDLGLDIE